MVLSLVIDGKVMFGAFLVVGLSLVWVVTTLVTKHRARPKTEDADQTSSDRVRAARRVDGDHVFAILEAVETNQRRQKYQYELTKAEEVAQLSQMIEVSFEAEGLEWAMAHYDAPEFRAMADVTDLLDLRDLSPILRNAADVRSRFDDRAFLRLGVEDSSRVAVTERIPALEASFRRDGGVDQVKNAAFKYVEQRYDWRV